MTDRRQPKKAVWKKKPPTKEGWYWYRDSDRSAVLHVFDPVGNGYWKGVGLGSRPPHALRD